MSQLFLGHRFACGNRSRIYHGEYKGQVVAVKILKLDDCKEAAKFERQFMQEVYCLSQLHHPNIVQVYNIPLLLTSGWCISLFVLPVCQLIAELSLLLLRKI